MSKNLKRHNLRFGIEKSIRYHTRMHGWYDTVNKIMILLTVVFGSSSVVNLVIISEGMSTAYLGGVAAFIAALSLVYAPATKASTHQELRNRFSDLAIDMDTNCENDDLNKWQEKRLRIEQSEFPVYCAVEADSDNEVRRAWGLDEELARISFFQRLTMYVWRYEQSPFTPKENSNPYKKPSGLTVDSV
ncbi:MAG: hypothetical protein OXC62_07375 [Aestuariivita sp.]|nr:hypothetical protein [Aestuariivita sp.]